MVIMGDQMSQINFFTVSSFNPLVLINLKEVKGVEGIKVDEGLEGW